MKICLNMIVKNEAARIVRALDSVAQFIDCWVITDTGSTDNTPQVIREYFAAHKIPGHVTHAPFVDWSQARNAALLAARAARYKWDYALLMDADMRLVMGDFPKFKEFLAGGLSYDLEQRAGSLHYLNRRLISAQAKGLYRGVTHEYLDVDTAGALPANVAYFIDHADGANRPEKYKRDIALLLAGLEREPNNERYFFYLAQSYRDAGQAEEALKWYKRRVDAGGWIEEQWNAQVNLAHCYKDLKNEGEFIRNMLIAYNMRPSRAESLFDLAHYFRHKDGAQNIASLFAEVGMTIPPTRDALFVNTYVYEAGLKEEYAITGFYNEQKRHKAFEVCDKLSLQPGPYHTAREVARYNLFWYLPTLKDVCPSFEWRNIPFAPPENWIAMNPSVTVHQGTLYGIVRTVNYRIDEHGRYLIRGTDGTANDSNPINTRNWLVSFGVDPMRAKLLEQRELLAPHDLPCEFKPVIGFEDMRLFSAKGALWTSSTVRQIHPDGNCEQVLARIGQIVGRKGSRNMPLEEHGPRLLEDITRMLRDPRETEKNWAPIGERPDDHREFLWMHRPGTTVNEQGKFVNNNPPPITTDIVSGGSQLIPSGPGYLALVHTAHQLPNSPCRYYFHRFVMYDAADFRVLALSRPFVFNEKVIEFAAGMCRHPHDPAKLVISYGFKDNEARIATISEAEVMRFLWSPSK